MTQFKLIAAAAISLATLASPAMARHLVSSHPGQSLYCATREPGNPHSKYCNFIAWSKWRQRGGWDSTLDNACFHNPAFIPGECGFDQQGRPILDAPLP
jgi:hypothetical protein